MTTFKDDIGIKLGFCVGPAYAVAWRVLDSRFFGVAQRRRRVFFVGHSSSDFRVPASILFERGSGVRNSAKKRGAGDSLAFALTSRTHKAGDPTTDTYVSLPLKGGGNSRHDATHETYVGTIQGGGKRGYRIGPEDGRDGRLILAHTLNSEGADASEDGTGRGVPICIQDDGTSFTLDGAPPVAFAENQRGEVRLMDVSPSLSTGGGKPERRTSCTAVAPDRMRDSSGVSAALDLCPSDEAGPDSPRYQALGNAVTVNVARWIFRRIETYRNSS